MRVSLLLAFLPIGLLLSGCAPAFFKYRYINLEAVEGIEVLEYGQSEVKNLFFHDDMPVTYLLRRDSYSLKFDIDKSSYGAAMTATLLGEEVENPLLQPGTLDGGVATVTFDDRSYLPGNALKFGPSSRFRYSERETYRVVFDIADDAGNRIARESIEFRLETNGVYYVIDAI